MRYCRVIVFILIGTTVCHGEEASVESENAGIEKKVSYTNIESAKEKMMEADYTGAIVDLGEVIIVAEDLLYRLYYMRGECHYKVNAFSKAETDYRKALNESKTGVAEYMVGKCLLNQGKYNEAHEFFIRALEKLPKNTILKDEGLKHSRYLYKYDLALTLFEMKRQKEAIQMFHAIQCEFPDEDMSAIMEYIESYRKTMKTPSSP